MSSVRAFDWVCCVNLAHCFEALAWLFNRGWKRWRLVGRSSSFWLSSLRDGTSFFSNAIAPDTFLRESPLTLIMSGSAVVWQTRIYLLRIPHRRVHSIQRLVPSWLMLAQLKASTVPFELDQPGGISSCTSLSVTQLGSNNHTKLVESLLPEYCLF